MISLLSMMVLSMGVMVEVMMGMMGVIRSAEGRGVVLLLGLWLPPVFLRCFSRAADIGRATIYLLKAQERNEHNGSKRVDTPALRESSCMYRRRSSTTAFAARNYNQKQSNRKNLLQRTIKEVRRKFRNAPQLLSPQACIELWIISASPVNVDGLSPANSHISAPSH